MTLEESAMKNGSLRGAENLYLDSMMRDTVRLGRRMLTKDSVPRNNHE